MMKRGEVWWINIDPSVGGEIRKQRPAVSAYYSEQKAANQSSGIDFLYRDGGYRPGYHDPTGSLRQNKSFELTLNASRLSAFLSLSFILQNCMDTGYFSA
jgi:hypothetical protein